ncbi:FHA domain-containing protein [Luteimonas vadosa]
MNDLKLRFADTDRELPLAIGVNAVGRNGSDKGTLGPLEPDANHAVRFCVDRRGVWLTVAEGTKGVHVNGREVRRMAMLRVGDAIYVDGEEMRLIPVRAPAPLSSMAQDFEETDEDDPRVVLRGVGGQYHGRSFTLQRPRLVGSARDADIRIDDPAFPERHARLELLGTQVVLRDLSMADGSEVNGLAVLDAVLKPGDQVVFDAHHRFVVEAPVRTSSHHSRGGLLDDGEHQTAEAMPAAESRGGTYRLPWLLLAAVLLAASLGALLLFGAS